MVFKAYGHRKEISRNFKKGPKKHSQMKKILLVVDEFFPIASAQAIRIHSFIKELQKKYLLEVLCGEETKERRNNEDRLAEVKYFTIPRPQEKEPIKFLKYFFRFNKKILSLSKKRNYDLIIITIPRYEFLYAINRLKTPYILDIRDLLTTKNYELIIQKFLPKILAKTIAKNFERQKKRSLKKAIQRSSITTVAYPGLLQYYMQELPKYKNKIMYIPNGVDLEYFPKEKKVFNTGKLHILYIGNFHEKDLLKEILEQLSTFKEKEKIKLFMVGTGREKDGLKKIIAKNGLLGMVEVLGKVHHSDIARIGRNADIGIILRDKNLPTLLPVSLVEYMAMGLPVIVNDYSELGDFVRKTQSGYVIHDPSELNPLLERILDKKDFSEISGRNREWIEEHGDRKKIAKEFEEKIVSKSI